MAPETILSDTRCFSYQCQYFHAANRYVNRALMFEQHIKNQWDTNLNQCAMFLREIL